MQWEKKEEYVHTQVSLIQLGDYCVAGYRYVRRPRVIFKIPMKPGK